MTSSGSMDTMNTQNSESFIHNEMPPESPKQPTLSPTQPPQTATPPPLLLQAPTSPPPPLPSLTNSQKKRKNDDLSEVFEVMRSAKKKMEEPKDEFHIYAEYVASELRHVNNEHAVLQAKYLINNILIEARMGKYNYTGYEIRPNSSHPESYGYSTSSQSRSIPDNSHVNDGVHDSSSVNNTVPELSSAEVTQLENVQESVSHFDSQDQ